ncbi:MAG TPA: hypothetical protein VGM89_02785, partial [Puia sp.]
MKKLLVIGSILTASIAATAQPTTILTNTTIIDGTGNAPQSHMAMIIQDGRITKITRGKIVVPDGAVQVDMTGKYLMPQLISCHSHVGNVRDTIASSANYTRANVLRQLKQYEDYGVGAILSMGTEQPLGISIREDSRAGLIPGATLYSALFGFGVKGAMPPEAAGFSAVYRPETPEEAAKQVDELATWHPDVIKMWVDNYYGQFQTTMKEEVY